MIESKTIVCVLPLPLGDGKTHYIKQQLSHSIASLTIAVNEAFTPLNAISKLRTLPHNQKNCAIFFNFTMLPPGVRGSGGRRGRKGKRMASTILVAMMRVAQLLLQRWLGTCIQKFSVKATTVCPHLPFLFLFHHRNQYMRVNKYTTSS